MSNWGNQGKQEANALTQYAARVKTAELTGYKTGSFGVKMVYELADKGPGGSKYVYENIVLRKMNEQGALEDTKYGHNSLRMRLLNFGMPAEQILAISFPATQKGELNLSAVIGAEVNLFCEEEQYNGRTQLRVKKLYAAGDLAEGAVETVIGFNKEQDEQKKSA